MSADVQIAVLQERMKAIQQTQTDIKDMLSEWRKELKEDGQELSTKIEVHEDRIKVLESWKQWVLGAAFVVGIGISLLSEKIKSIFVSE
jgi:cob(I)alamin adenosyltransferase